MKDSGTILKSLREEYNLSQRDCSSAYIDRSLISHIESGKFIMSEDVAKIIANNINRVFVERNIDRRIDYIEFYEEKYKILQQATKQVNLLDEYMEKNNIKQFETEMANLDEILNEYALTEIKLRVLEIAAKMAKKQKDYFKAYTYCLRALDLAIFTKDEYKQVDLYMAITFYLFNMEKYEEVVKVAQQVLERYKFNYNSNLFLYNCGICLKQLSRYDEAIIYFDKIDIVPSKDNVSQIADIKLNLAACYKNINKIEKSLDMLNKVIEMFDGDFSYHVANSYNLLINNYIELNNSAMVEKYIDKLVNIVRVEDVNFIYPELFMELGDAFVYLMDYDKAHEYYLSAVRSAVINKRYKIISKIVNKLQINLISNKGFKDKGLIYDMFKLIVKAELNEASALAYLTLIYNIISEMPIKAYINGLIEIIQEGVEKNEKTN